MIKNILKAIGIAAAAIAVSSAGVARADAVADFYKGKSITVIVGFSAGGTYTLYARLLARHLSKHIPGAPKFVVQNMPGGGGIKSTNFAYNISPRDGSVIAMPSDAIALTNVLTPERVKYDANEFRYIGSCVQTAYVMVARSDTGVRNFEDLTKKQVILSASGGGSMGFLMPKMLQWASDAKIKLVAGYRGSRPQLIAIERGESHGAVFAWTAWKTLKPEWFKSGFLTPIVQFGPKREPDMPNVPLGSEVVKTAAQKTFARFMATNSIIGRGFMFPPKVPADRVAAVRAAFDRMVVDPDYIADAKKRGAFMNPARGIDVQAAVADAMKTDRAIIASAKAVMFPKKK
jgi:tripartite-type tricarboxylate transporter receptor subunit TctC